MSNEPTGVATADPVPGSVRDRLIDVAMFVSVMAALVAAIEVWGALAAGGLMVAICGIWLLWREIPWYAAFCFYLGVLLLIPVNIYRLPVSLPLDFEPQRVALLCIAGAWAATLLIDPRARLKATGLGGPSLLLVATAVVSMVVNARDMQPGGGLVAVKAFAVLLSVLLVCLLAAAAVPDLKAARILARWLVIIGVALSLAAFLERVTEFNVFRHIHTLVPILQFNPGLDLAQTVLFRGGGLRVSGSAEHPIAFGAILVMLLPFAAYRFAQATGSRARLAAGIAVGLIGAASLLTGSRTVVVGLAVTLLLVFWSEPKMRSGLVVWGLVGLFAIHMAFPGALGGFRATLQPSYINANELNNPGHGRGQAYPVVAENVRNRPLVGMGFGRWDPEEITFTDNEFLLMTVELGILGLIGFIWFIGVAVVRPWRARGFARDDAALLVSFAASCAAFGAMSMTYDTLGFPQGTYLFFAFAGIGCGLATTLRREPPIGDGGG